MLIHASIKFYQIFKRDLAITDLVNVKSSRNKYFDADWVLFKVFYNVLIDLYLIAYLKIVICLQSLTDARALSIEIVKIWCY